MENKIIVMFQKDFRLYDNPALFEAAQSGEEVRQSGGYIML